MVLHWDDLSFVFITVGDADILWHPQFFSAIAIECKRLTYEEFIPKRGEAWSANLFWRKSLCEVAESVIRRPQNNILWTGSVPEYRDAVCVGFLRNSTVILWTFTSERSTERGSLFPFFVLAMEAREGPNTSRQSRESHGETRSTVLSQNLLVESVIRRLQITSSWTSSGAECRDAVCVGILRNCSHAVSGRFQSTVLSLALESVN